MVTAQLKLALALGLALLYSGFATYKWLSSDTVNELKCDSSALQTELEGLKAANKLLADDLAAAYTLQRNQPVLGDQARNETQQTFAPLQEDVREVRVPYCPGEFEPRVRGALTKAVAAANEG